MSNDRGPTGPQLTVGAMRRLSDAVANLDDRVDQIAKVLAQVSAWRTEIDALPPGHAKAAELHKMIERAATDAARKIAAN